ncbi:MAG TPA: peptidylprolyl isomerase, partial [Saprospiraceae bacterium]|nr:peptidylprolyl isomerase [Saprospiraceae bacterium]
MLKHLITSALLCCWSLTAALAQQDPALFTVDGKPVPVSEFKYIYSKTNQDKADFSEKSLRDYLDLYINFKLKVRKARDMQLDTVSSTQSELDGYRRQLAKSYLEDKEVTEKLVHEVYDRTLQDVDISHIFIACDRNAKAADTLRAYNRAMAWLAKIKGGTPFERMAQDSSEDKSAKENKGSIGYLTAMLPDGYYALEQAVYGTPVGQVYPKPVRSANGYHLLRVNATRPARGEVEVAQILLRKTADNPAKNEQAKMRADSLYNLLRTGAAKWDDLCTRFSDDKQTSPKGGYIGFFGINRYQRNFEDAAFSIDADGGVASPIETALGYHIIKRISRRPIGSFDSQRKVLTDRVKRDSRSEMARQSIIRRIQREGNFRDYPQAFQQWMSRQQDSIFLTFRWKPDPAKPQTPLLQYGSDKIFTVADFEEYCARSS